jgi:hypothetical protein
VSHTSPSPRVLAAADQFLAACAAGATGEELGKSIFQWLGGPWVAGAPKDALVLVDCDLAGLAFYLVSCISGPTEWELRDPERGVIDQGVALRDRPELHGFVVPLIALQYVSESRAQDARLVWSKLSLAAMAGDPQRIADRTNSVVSAISLLVHRASVQGEVEAP